MMRDSQRVWYPRTFRSDHEGTSNFAPLGQVGVSASLALAIAQRLQKMKMHEPRWIHRDGDYLL